MIDTERVSSMAGPAKSADQVSAAAGPQNAAPADGSALQRMKPDNLAAEYLHLAYQPRDVYTQELDLRCVNLGAAPCDLC